MNTLLTRPLRSALALLALLATMLLAGTALAQGKLEKIKVASAALKGNLEGDSAERDVFVYLPPGYDKNDGKRYPVIYFLHGYGVGAQVYVERVLALPGSADKAMADGKQAAILVLPDAFSKYGGSMYSNSATVGDWETFIGKELVSYVDSHYRTLAKRESRGLSGHSMGGYGTMRIGMVHPEMFGALYAMSACCLLNTAPTQQAVEQQLERMKAPPQPNEPVFAKAMLAQAAAWAPNPQNPPDFFDFPFVNGEAQPLVQGKWTANSPLINVDQHVPALKQYKAIAIDVGDKDNLNITNKQLEVALTRLGVAHSFELYEGDHGNRIGQRFVDKLLPFFAANLSAK